MVRPHGILDPTHGFQLQRRPRKYVIDSDAKGAGLDRPGRGLRENVGQIAAAEKRLHVGFDHGRIEIAGEQQRLPDCVQGIGQGGQFVGMEIVEIGFAQMGGGEGDLLAIDVDGRQNEPVSPQPAEATDRLREERPLDINRLSQLSSITPHPMR